MHLHPSKLVGMATLHPHTAIPLFSLYSACQKQIAMGCFPLTPLAVLTYPRGKCKTGCGDEIVIFLFPFFFFFPPKIVGGVSLAIFSSSKKNPFMEYSASSWSSSVASGGCGYTGDDSRVLSCSRAPKTPLLLSLSLSQQFVLIGLWLPTLTGI